jgi:hypothetical protein
VPNRFEYGYTPGKIGDHPATTNIKQRLTISRMKRARQFNARLTLYSTLRSSSPVCNDTVLISIGDSYSCVFWLVFKSIRVFWARGITQVIITGLCSFNLILASKSSKTTWRGYKKTQHGHKTTRDGLRPTSLTIPSHMELGSSMANLEVACLSQDCGY